MSNKGLVLRQNISNIANTIRKNSTIQTTYKPRELAEAIQTTIDKYKNNNPTSTVTDGVCSNALDVPVKNYKIYGNSTQETITGKNLLPNRKSSGSVSGLNYTYRNNILTVNGTATNDDTFYLYFNENIILDGTYTFSAETNTTNSQNINLRYGYGNAYLNMNYTNGYKKTETLSNVTVNDIYFQVRSGFYYNNVEFKLMLEKNNEKTSFEPSFPQEITSVGDLVESGEYAGKYKIPVKNSGKNLLNITNVEPYIYGYGLPTNNATDFTISSFSSNSLSFSSQVNGYRLALLDTIKLEPNTTYTISYTRTNSLTQGAYARRWLYNWNEIDGYTMLFALNDSDSGNMSYTFTTDSYGYLGIAFGFNNNASGSSSVVSNIQIEKGSTATDFEPYHEPITTNIYLDEPLRKIDTSKDLINYLTQKRTNNIKKVTLSAGTHTLSDAKNNGNYMCTQQLAGTLTGQVLTLNTGVTNADVHYELATETEENITLPQLNFWEGTNIVEIGTDTEATQEIVYITKVS